MILFLSACSGYAGKKDKGTLYLRLSAEPETLNPIIYTDAYSANVFGYIYEPMVERDSDTLEFNKPVLAKRWTISPDGLKYRFFLKKGVYWSDGVEFTADDVIFSYNIIMNPKVACARLRVYYLDVKSVRKIDRYTVEFVYKKPYFLAIEFSGGMTILPKHIFSKGKDFNKHKNNRLPIGTGPYIFKQWDTGKRIILERNKIYHGVKPDINRINFKFISETNIALQMLKKGELDYMDIRSIQWARQTNSEKFKKKFYKLKYYLPSYSYIGWNMRDSFFADKRVRVAMTHFINRKELLDKLQFGLGKIVTGNFYVNGKNYDQNIKPYEFNPEKGKLLLKEAGWEDSNADGKLDRKGKDFSFTLMISSGSKSSERISTILKEDLSRIGISMKIVRFEWAVFLQKIDKRDFQAVILGWSLGFGEDPYQLWHSSMIEKGSNLCGFNNKEADDIIEKGRVELNPKKRAKLYRRFHAIIHEVQPYTFLFCSPQLKVLNKRFTNVIIHNMGLDLKEWKVAK